ncbi:acyl carrier protein [Kitasatospora sp. LaBMicrA B282]|uniref:acyl carrier protein n=1 Tax=Kitasatospora sp. LaBMicrA B282 TaxID=3420949 RepID=UPI003D142A92
MGEHGRLRKPALPPGRLQDLNGALHALHLQAGQPSLGTMSEWVGRTISRTRLHDAFTEPRLPAWEVVDALIEILASRAPGLTVREVQAEIHALWVLASIGRSKLRPTEDEVFREVAEIIAHVMYLRVSEISRDSKLYADLLLDSATELETFGEIEEAFGVEIIDKHMQLWETVGEVVDGVRALLEAQPGDVRKS